MAPIFFNCHTHRKAQLQGEFIIRNAFLPLSIPAVNYPLSIGLHPWFASRMSPEESRSRLKQLAFNISVVAIGETGLDKLRPDWELQKQHLLAHIEVARITGLPLVIHNVKSTHELLRMLSSLTSRIILHGFTGSIEDYQQLSKKADTYISLGKSILQPSEKSLSVMQQLPMDRVLLETDDANITIQQVYQAFSEHRKYPSENLTEQIRSNFFTAFPKANQFQL